MAGGAQSLPPSRVAEPRPPKSAPEERWQSARGLRQHFVLAPLGRSAALTCMGGHWGWLVGRMVRVQERVVVGGCGGSNHVVTFCASHSLVPSCASVFMRES